MRQLTGLSACAARRPQPLLYVAMHLLSSLSSLVPPWLLLHAHSAVLQLRVSTELLQVLRRLQQEPQQQGTCRGSALFAALAAVAEKNGDVNFRRTLRVPPGNTPAGVGEVLRVLLLVFAGAFHLTVAARCFRPHNVYK